MPLMISQFAMAKSSNSGPWLPVSVSGTGQVLSLLHAYLPNADELEAGEGFAMIGPSRKCISARNPHMAMDILYF